MEFHEHPTDPTKRYPCIGGPAICIVCRAVQLLDEMCELGVDGHRIIELANAQHEASHE